MNFTDNQGQSPAAELADEVEGAGVATAVSPQVAMEAVELFVDLQGEDATDLTRQKLQQWRTKHPDHERAWQHIATVNGRFEALGSSAGRAVAHASISQPAMISRRDMIKTLSVLLFTTGTAWTVKEQTPWQQWVADERTWVGERRVVPLAGGGKIEMNTDSALNVIDHPNGRSIRLVQGEILITTAENNLDSGSHPIMVETSQGNLLPQNARFSVREQGEFCSLAVLDGAVEIRPKENQIKSRVIYAGEQVRFNSRGIDKTFPTNANSVAWTQGMIVASGMPLADFLAELSRYRRGRLRCAPDIAGLRVSGTYPLASTDRILAALETSLSVKVHYLTRYFVTIKSLEA